MNYEELLAKSIYEAQNEPKLWADVGRDYPHMAMREAWLNHARQQIEKHLDRAESSIAPLPLSVPGQVASLQKRVKVIERLLLERIWP